VYPPRKPNYAVTGFGWLLAVAAIGASITLWTDAEARFGLPFVARRQTSAFARVQFSRPQNQEGDFLFLFTQTNAAVLYVKPPFDRFQGDVQVRECGPHEQKTVVFGYVLDRKVEDVFRLHGLIMPFGVVRGAAGGMVPGWVRIYHGIFLVWEWYHVATAFLAARFSADRFSQ
jgi:hypothetical protein